MKFDDLKSNFEPAPEGVRTGILASFIDLGDQQNKFGVKRQARLKWVLPATKNEKGEPLVIFQTIWNLSIRSQAFRDIVSALLPDVELKGLSLRELVGKAGKLTVQPPLPPEYSACRPANVRQREPIVRLGCSD